MLRSTSPLGSGMAVRPTLIRAPAGSVGSRLSPWTVVKLGPGPSVATLMLVVPGNWPVITNVASKSGEDKSAKPASEFNPTSNNVSGPLVDVWTDELSQA